MRLFIAPLLRAEEAAGSAGPDFAGTNPPVKGNFGGKRKENRNDSPGKAAPTGRSGGRAAVQPIHLVTRRRAEANWPFRGAGKVVWKVPLGDDFSTRTSESSLSRQRKEREHGRLEVEAAMRVAGRLRLHRPGGRCAEADRAADRAAGEDKAVGAVAGRGDVGWSSRRRGPGGTGSRGDAGLQSPLSAAAPAGDPAV